MSPAASMDFSMPSGSSSLFNIPQLPEDGSNWVTYKNRMLIALRACSLGEYVEGTATKTAHYVANFVGVVVKVDRSTASQDEIKENRKEVNEYEQKDSLIQQHIFSTITDCVMLQLESLDSGSAMWKELQKLHEGKSALVKVVWEIDSRCSHIPSFSECLQSPSESSLTTPNCT